MAHVHTSVSIYSAPTSSSSTTCAIDKQSLATVQSWPRHARPLQIRRARINHKKAVAWQIPWLAVSARPSGTATHAAAIDLGDGVHEQCIVSRSPMRVSTHAVGVSGPRGAAGAIFLGHIMRGRHIVTRTPHFASTVTKSFKDVTILPLPP